MSRRLILGTVLVLLLLVTVACAARDEGGTGETRSRLRVSGSGTALPLVRILTDQYADPDVQFVYLPGLHSGGGIRGVANGELEIGTVSRELAPDEAELDLEYIKLADDGLVMAVHPSVTIDNLSSEQVSSIYRGEHSNWNELGGPDLPIVILDRNEDESAKIILREYVLGPDLQISDKAVNLFYEPDMVEGLLQTEGAIGYFSLGLGISANIPVRYLKLDGVTASVETIKDGSYTMVRPLGIVLKRPVEGELGEFAQWVVGDEARSLAVERGFAPPQTPVGD